ncbi:sugar transferase [Pedobacter changchengzhani]|uniref:Sugar transferase n=1 Tax=Pedobacter changchengzhani TaxID=2529274 RepID=A0A4R5MN94_9SPHI|nr:sugar transferase [Pedobacter changchengzhani]TDG37214.1 sugar transferase [Pedobacter changchengzhani]
MQHLAPIALFVYNRPKHTLRTIKFLQQNELAAESRLFIFSDGPKTNQDIDKVTEVRDIIKNIDGFKSVKIIERKGNIGLAESIIQGVTEIVELYGQIIVFEDDLITSPHTLRFFNDGLTKYKAAEKVMHIGAYMYPLKENNLPESFFYQIASSWGWATWASAWQHFEPNIDKLIAQFDKSKIASFSIDHKMNFWKQVKEFKNGKNNSWAIRWYASIFLKGGLTLNPSKSLINNIGSDGSGVHSGISDIYNVVINPKPITYFPEQLVQNKDAYELVKEFLAGRKGNLWQRIKRYMIQRFNKN